MTFNLLHGGPWSGLSGDGDHLEARLAMVADELRRRAPDVVALQEASVGRGRGNVAARLAAALGLADLPRCVRFLDPRVALRAVLATPAGELSVISTHTSHDGCQTRRVATIAREAEAALPSLAMGVSRIVLDTPRRRPDGGALWPSDHYGVLADVRVVPRPAAH